MKPFWVCAVVGSAGLLAGCSAERTPVESPAAAAPPVRVQVAALPSTAPAPAASSGGTTEARARAGAAEPASDENPEARALARCVLMSKLSACVPLFAGKLLDDLDSPEVQAGANCTRQCIGARVERLKPQIDAAVATCREAYEKSRGKAAARCVFPKPTAASDPRLHSMRFQDALRAALEKPNAATATALDAVLPIMDGSHWYELEPACTKRCRAEGAAALAATTGP